MPTPSPNAPPLPALGDLDYQIQARLPTSTKMSEILLATDRQGQTVVFKIACVQQQVRAASNRRAIHNSAAWLQQLCDHPGIAQLRPICYRKHARGQAQGHAEGMIQTFVAALSDWPGAPDFLITEYLAGGTLENLVGKEPLPVDLTLALTYELAQTLTYLHARGCVHRDLKPENILFRTPPPPQPIPGELQPVLIDFGVAARIGEHKLVARSPLWAAPELQSANEKEPLPVDPSWDIYALALICCYMLSGRQPLRRRTYHYQDCIDYRDSVFALLQGEAAQADAGWQQLVTDLQHLLTHALAPTPDQRPTAAEFATTLATLLLRMGITPPSRLVASPSMALTASEQDSLWQRLYCLFLPIQATAMIGANRGGGAAKLLQSFAGSWPGGQKVGRWVGIALLSLLGGSLLLTIFAEQPPATNSVAGAAQLPPAMVVQRATATVAAPKVAVVSPTQPTATLPPAPTKALVSIPTLVRITVPQSAPPPTLVRFTPTAPPTATPTATEPVPTATATSRPPTATLPPTPTRPLPTATVRPEPTALRFAAIRLRQPAPNVVAAQERVEFAWEATGATPATDHCYELVFWDPAKARDKRSPTGAGRAASGVVNFSKLRESADPLLRSLAHSPRGFDWGVRFVSCASPQTILQEVGDTRHYTYQP